jgi:hypothetical protein
MGEAFTPNRLTQLVREYIQAADLAKTGSCHLLRHTMATLMLENGADIRYIQAMLGHAELSWGATALAAETGALGSTAQQQATQTNEQLAGAWNVVTSFPEQTAATVGAFVSQYPFQTAARVGTGAAVSIGFSPLVGIPTSLLAIYGTAFQNAYQHPAIVAALAVVGQACGKQ